MNIEKRKIDDLKLYFETKPVLKAYIFGSVAKNSDNKNSDIDILIDLDYSKKIGLLFIQMKLDLEKMLGKKVDLVSSGGISPFMKEHIDREKQLVYAR